MAFRWSPTAAFLVILAYQLESVVGRTKLCQEYTPTVEGGRCTPTKERCDFKLVVAPALTMTTPDGTAIYLSTTAHTAHRSDTNQQLSDEELRKVILADGYQPARLVTVVNGTMPGPCIAFYKGQVVTVEVVNGMNSEGLTIHWHGIDMQDNSYMDGVAFISQCPIQSGQSFVYNFTSYHPGTYWYHSHIGAQHSMGILGPLIVREKDDSNPAYDERTLVLQEWNHDFSSERMELGVYHRNGSTLQWLKQSKTETYDGTFFSAFQFHSGLINGRGRFFENGALNIRTPLEVIEVEEGRTYRFRVIAAGAIYPYRLAVEGHGLSMEATDGHDFKAISVESFIIHPGERYDFTLTTDQTPKDYMIFAETLENMPKKHKAEAILRYKSGRPGVVPNATPQRSCQGNCSVFNCPFKIMPGAVCTLLSTARPHVSAPKAPQGPPGEIKQIFLNFGFPGPRSDASVNGIRFEKPLLPAILHPNAIPNACPAHCGEAGQLCDCAHKVKLERGKIHQIILVNMGQGQNFSHPIHIHGYSFYVVKMGFPDYLDTGKIRRANVDIRCPDNPDPDINYCNKATWANDSWNQDPNIIPGLTLNHAIRKDTIILPSGGYVIVRLKADNPGMWFVHCHIEKHNLGGMALMFDATDGQGPPPKGFPTCDSFRLKAGSTTGISSTLRATSPLTVLLLIVAFIGFLLC
ncbi:uncharacterized protein [Littorina saxatilis]|uniref:Uncharacterized protein n=1 Tax=Littorina saxatilis TaxID=31220 RepID=A0AAN9BEU2_9CAEN